MYSNIKLASGGLYSYVWQSFETNVLLTQMRIRTNNSTIQILI